MATERDKDLTSFVTPEGGLYRYRFMPFGLRNAGAIWTRFIDGALSDLRWNICLVYADDCLIFTKQRSVMTHIDHLNSVFSRLRSSGIMIKGSKVRLGVKELSFLGQIINKDGYRPDPSKVKAVADLLPPTNVHQLRRVLGLFSYYRKYIPKFAEIAAPLYSLTGKNVQNKRDSQRRIVMNQDQQRAFEALKLKLTSEPVFLHFPRWDCPFEVHCDGSKQGVAAVLTQIVDGDEKVLVYASKSLTPAELGYIPYEQEALAMVWSIDLFAHYLRGRPFIVKSDCQALQWLKDKRPRGVRINKWLLRLQEYDYKVVHRPGAKSANCDGLTRQPLGISPEVDPFEALPSDERVVSVMTRAQASKVLLDPDDSEEDIPLSRSDGMDFKYDSEDSPDNKAKPPSAPSAGDDDAVGSSIDEASFENPFRRRRSNTKPFFACDGEREGWDKATWVEEQQTSKFVQALLTTMAKQPDLANQHTLVDGVWHKKADLTKSLKARLRVLVPESLRAFVIGQHHNLELHGHQGRRRTQAMITSRYYWPGMCEHISRWIRSCSACARRKTTRPMNSGLTTVTLSTEPWETVGIDILGPLPVTEDGYKWLLTIVDQFTRWPCAVPLRSRSSAEIARALHDHLITQHGPPKTILSDRGRELISKSIQQLCESWGVRRVATGGYNPTGNAFCERFHRYLNSAITTLRPGSVDSPEWDRLVPAVLFSYRCSVNDSTGFSPYYLLHGKDPRLPSDLLFEVCETKMEYVADYVQTLQSNLKAAFQLARSQQYAAAIGNRERAAEKSRPAYKVGDKVYVWERSSKDSLVQNSGTKDLTKLPSKWLNSWSGPFDFLEWISERSCMIDYKGKPTLYPTNRLTKHTSWDTVNPDTNEWCLRNRKGDVDSVAQPSAPVVFSPDAPVPIPSDFILQPDDIFVFPMEMNDENLLPFGMGKVLDHTKNGFIHFQWMSNYTQNSQAKFLPMWFQNSDKKSYYKVKPTAPSHKAYTGKDLGVFIKAEDVIILFSDRPFLEDGVLTPWARKHILKNEFVAQSIQDFGVKRQAPMH